MTGQELKTFVETIVDSNIDDEAFLVLLNTAKDKLEGERDWSFLQVLDSSQSATSSAIPLPTTIPYSRTLSLYVGSIPYHQIPFEQSKMLANSAQRWYLDLRNSCYYILGNAQGTINHFYIWKTPDLTLATSPVFDSRYHKILAFECAELFYALDGGERGRSWDDKWAIQKRVLKNAMVDWDVALNRRASENAVPIDYEPEISVGDL
jgi:hypothetical protein